MLKANTEESRATIAMWHALGLAVEWTHYPNAGDWKSERCPQGLFPHHIKKYPECYYRLKEPAP